MILSTLYFLLPLSCFAASFIKEFKRYRFPQYSLLSFLALFYCFGYMTGTDWQNYERHYNHIATSEETTLEKGYVWISMVSSSLKIPFWDFFILLRLFCFFSLVILLYKFSGNFWLCLGMFIGKNLIGLMIENVMRNMLAMSFFWVSCIICYRYKSSAIPFFLLPIAALFHNSAFILFPFLLLSLLFKKLSSKYGFILFITTWVFLANQELMLNQALQLHLLFDHPRLAAYFANPESQYMFGKAISVTSFAKLFIGTVLFKYRKQIVNHNDSMPMVFSCTIVWILVDRLATSIPILARVGFYFLPFYYITLTMLLKNIIRKDLAKVLLFLIVAHNLIGVYSIINSSHKYVPYSNYLFYAIQGEELPFSYRCEYNRKNSPFKVSKFKKSRSLLFSFFE